jgi:hypothetical protein
MNNGEKDLGKLSLFELTFAGLPGPLSSPIPPYPKYPPFAVLRWPSLVVLSWVPQPLCPSFVARAAAANVNL